MKRPTKNSRRDVLRFERLEDRLAMSGDVSAALSAAGDLTIKAFKGDTAENSIHVFFTAAVGQNPAKVTVAGSNQTNINPTQQNPQNAFTEFNLPANGNLRHVLIDLGTAVTGGVAGADAVLFEDLHLTGKLTIKGKSGGNVAVSDTIVDGAAAVTFGAGKRNVQGNQGSLVEFASSSVKQLTVKTANDNDDVNFLNSFTKGNVSVKTNGGNDAVDINGNYAPDGNISNDLDTISGNVDVQTGAGEDFIRLNTNKVKGKVTLKGGTQANTIFVQHNVLGMATNFSSGGSPKPKCNDVLISSDNADVGTVDSVTVEDNYTAKNLTITTKAGNDNILMRNTWVGFHCIGNLKISTADGNDTVNLDGRALAGDTVQPTGNFFGTGNRVTGATSITSALGNDQVQIGRGDLVGINRLQGVTNISLGDGNNRTALVSNLTGNSVQSFNSKTIFEKDVNVSGGKNDDSVLAVGVLMKANHTVKLGDGNNVVAPAYTAILGNLSVTTGGGSDTLGIGTIDPFLAPNFVGGTTTVGTGAGDDLVEGDNVNFVGKVTATLAGGRDQLQLHNNTLINLNTASANGGSPAEDNRGEVNGVDLGTQGVAGFSAGGVDANFGALVDAAIDARFHDLIAEILAVL